VKTRALDRTRFVNYRGRADEFFHGMQDEAELERFGASALLGVHASIALADALTIHETGKRAADEQHKDAVRLLAWVCSTRNVEEGGCERLGRILAKKNEVAYSRRYVPADTNELKELRRNVEGFFGWAYKNFKHLGEKPTQEGA
jgi:hypothetical protein